jgi:hypothetical protein
MNSAIKSPQSRCGHRGGAHHPIITAPCCPFCSVTLIRDQQWPSTKQTVVVVFHMVMAQCPATAVVSAHLWWSTTYSPEKHCQGGGGSYPSSFVIYLVACCRHPHLGNYHCPQGVVTISLVCAMSCHCISHRHRHHHCSFDLFKVLFPPWDTSYHWILPTNTTALMGWTLGWGGRRITT